MSVLHKKLKEQQIAIRLTARDKSLIRSRAKRFADGNVTLFVTEAALKYVPKEDGGKKK